MSTTTTEIVVGLVRRTADDNYADRLRRRIDAARQERDRVDEGCRMAARLAVFDPDTWDARYEAAYQRGCRLDRQIEDLEHQLEILEAAR